MSEQAKLHQNSQTLSLSFESSLIQSCMRLADPDELVLDYTRAMMGFLLFNPAPRSVLMIGLGGGALHKYIHKHLPETDLTTVEINPGVIELRQTALYRTFAQLLQQRDEADGVCRLMQKIEYDQRDIEDLLE